MAKRRSVALAECTNQEVARYLETRDTVLIPVGATEQHGPHAPLATDTLIAAEVSERLARRLDALVAPAIPYGVSADHRGFQGLCYLSAPVLAALVGDICLSLAEVGFRRIIVVNGHAGNLPALAVCAGDLAARLPPGTVVYPLNYWDGLTAEKAAQYVSREVGLHGNVGETSVVMAVDGSLVDLDAAVAETPKFPMADWDAAWAVFYRSARPGPGVVNRISRSGVWGDPTNASADKGLAYLHDIEDSCTKLITELERLETAFRLPTEPK